MADESDETSSGAVWAWAAVAIAIGAGVAVGVAARAEANPLVKELIHHGFAVATLLAGLLILFPLAAFGPKTQRARKSRVRMAVVGVSQIVIGFAQLIPGGPVHAILAAVAGLFLVGAVFKVPGRWFASAANGPA